MSNIIINKDRWQPKPKYNKVKENDSKKYHSLKDRLLLNGYTEEEAVKILQKESIQSAKKQFSKKQFEIRKYIKLKLNTLNIEQQNRLLTVMKEDFKNKKISKIKEVIDKLNNSIQKDKGDFDSKFPKNLDIKKNYKKKEFNTVKDLRKGSYKIKKK